MAQSKSFFGLRRGSTKSLTFSTFNGKQVTKDRVTDVKNPRTEAQMINRMLNYTAMSAYSAMKEIVDHSFASKSYGLQSMRHFLSRNYSLLKYGTETMSYSSYKGGVVPSQYLVSEGSLPKLNFEIAKDTGTISFTIPGTTYADLKSFSGLKGDDYFTMVALTDRVNNRFIWVRCFVPQDTMNNAEITGDNLETESNINSSSILKVEKVETNKTKISFTIEHDSYAVGTIISSAKRGDVWQRSTNYMEALTSESYSSYDEAIATYPVGASYILNGGDK